MEKFTVGQSINYSLLINSISNFVHKVKTKPDGPYQALQLKHRSNIFTNNDIDFNFLNHCILHCVIQQLNGAIDDLDEHVDSFISSKMRQFYFKMTTEGSWKKQFDFQQTIVCVTKMVAEFYSDTFTNVYANTKLESQIFIILVHTLMGINVGMKCFQMLEKKYLKQQSKSNDKTENCRKTLMTKITSRQSMFMYSISNMASTNSYFNKVKDAGSKDEAEQFKEMVKQNLYIDPLPKIKKSKKSIQSFGNENQNFHGRLSHGITKQYEQQIRKKPLYSTQISLSLKSQIQKRHVSIAENNRPFKIKHRAPFNSSHIVVFKNNLMTDNLNLDQQQIPKQKLQHRKLNSVQWQSQIKHIKQKINLNQSFKFNEKKIKDKDSELQQNKIQKLKMCFQQFQKGIDIVKNQTIQNQEKKIQIRKTISSNSCLSSDTCMTIPGKDKQNVELFKTEKDLHHKKRKNSSLHEQENQFARLDYGVKNYREIALIDSNSNQTYFQKPKKSVFNPKQLKQQKSLFNLNSKQRKNKIQYSMFMLPSMRIQYNK